MRAVVKPFWIAALALFLLFSAGFVQSDLFFQIKKQLTIFSDVFKEVSTRYVEEISPETLMKRGLNGMLSGLDPYTVFIDEGEQQQMEILSSGTYGGIGIEVGFRGGQVVIIAPLDGYPAQRAGIRPGDIIEELNGVPVHGFSPEEVQRLTIGDVGTRIEIKIRRPGIDQSITFELERERIEIKNISLATHLHDHNDIGYIQLTRFGQRTAEELRARLLELNDENKLRGLILDLRNNPGGLLNEAVDVVDKFIEPGVTVVETRGRLDSQNDVFTTGEPALIEDMPIVILINSGSASASEVVAGALQDLDRAVVIGENSFGKGLVQTIRPLSYNTSLKITISQYYTPSGRGIQSVDYTGEKNLSGSAFPDSLRRAFLTKNGRTVFDGNGIEPDIIIESNENSLLELALMQNNLFFFFVNERLANLNEDEKKIPEDIYRQFSRYLIEGGFTFDTPVDSHLDAISSNLNHFPKADLAEESLDELRALLRDYKISQIFDNRDFIERELRSEWISQTIGGVEGQRLMLQHDNYVLKSIELLKNQNQYKSLLIP
jgi:carboxyl-terminal processing protease